MTTVNRSKLALTVAFYRFHCLLFYLKIHFPNCWRNNLKIYTFILRKSIKQTIQFFLITRHKWHNTGHATSDCDMAWHQITLEWRLSRTNTMSTVKIVFVLTLGNKIIVWRFECTLLFILTANEGVLSDMIM